MRVIAGIWGGRPLASPGPRVRPTQDRVRQILFDILSSSVQEGPVLDLYAGTGALGLEALSRGAPAAVFVEGDARTRRVLQRNCDTLGAGGQARILGLPVLRALTLLEQERARFRWILADPPYSDAGTGTLLERLGRSGCPLLLAGGGFVLECRTSEPPPAEVRALREVRCRKVGETALHFFAPREEGV